MLKSCFHADISPSLAESILIKQKPASYLVRQGDRDPSKLILSFYKDGRTKHIVIPDFGTEGCNRRLVKDRLEDTSYEVDKLLVSYDCRHPVVPFIPVSPVPQWKKRNTELSGGPGRCSICPAVGDPKKMVRHLQNHQVKLCHNCDKYVMSSDFSYHSKKCIFDREKLLTCPHDKCDFSTFHKGNLAKHEMVVHSKPFVCEVNECDKKFGKREQLEKHMKKHEKRNNKEKVKRTYVNNSDHCCQICGEVFGSLSTKYLYVTQY